MPAQVCVVCGTAVDVALEACPTCSEPRVRICKCKALITLDLRGCPACGRQPPRVISMGLRAQRRRKRRIVAWSVGAAVLAAATWACWPLVRASQRATALRERSAAAFASGDMAAAVEPLTEYLALEPGDARAHAELAIAHLSQGDTEAGLAEARRALAIDPDSPGTHAAVARHLLANDDPLAALAALSGSKDAESHALLGRVLATLGRRVPAAAAFDAALSASPDDLRLRAEAAAAHAVLGSADWPLADTHRARANELAAETIRAAGSTLSRSGPGAADAARALVEALALRPPVGTAAADVESQVAAALRAAPADHELRLDAARALTAAGRKAAALAALGDAPAGKRSDDLLVARARALRDSGGEATAEEELHARLAANPADTSAAIASATLRLDLHRAADALAILAAARAGGARETPALFETLADAAALAGSGSDSIKHLLAWRASFPADPRPLRRLLDLRMPTALQRRRAAVDADDGTRTALADLEAIAELDSDDRTFLYWRARWDDLAGRTAEVDQRFARLVDLYPDDPAVRALRIERSFDGRGAERANAVAASWAGGTVDPPLADARAFTSEALRRGAYTIAVDAAAAGIEKFRNDPTLLANLAHALLATGRPAAAAAAIDAFADVATRHPELAGLRNLAAALSGDTPSLDEIAPADADFDQVLSAASVLSLAGRTADADHAFRRAREAAGSSPASISRVAAALESADRFEEAALTWDAALAFAPRDIDVQTRCVTSRLTGRTRSEPEVRASAAARLVVVRARNDAETENIALRGAFSCASGDTDSGILDLRRALESLPDRQDLRLILAGALLDVGRPSEAASEARAARSAHPESIPARRLLSLALMRLAAAKAESGELLAALGALEESSTLVVGAGDPAESPALGLRRAKLTSESAAICAEDRANRRAGAALVLALCAAARGEAGPADELATEGTDLRPDLPGGPVVRAFVRGLANRAADAAADIALAKDRNAPEADVAFTQALVFSRDGKPDEAIATLSPWADPGDPSRTCAAAAELLSVADASRDRALDVFLSLIGSAADEPDSMGLHAWGAALAARATTTGGGTSGDASAKAAARRTLRRALVVRPRAAEAAASREALSRLR